LDPPAHIATGGVEGEQGAAQIAHQHQPAADTDATAQGLVEILLPALLAAGGIDGIDPAIAVRGVEHTAIQGRHQARVKGVLATAGTPGPDLAQFHLLVELDQRRGEQGLVLVALPELHPATAGQHHHATQQGELFHQASSSLAPVVSVVPGPATWLSLSSSSGLAEASAGPRLSRARW